MHQYSASFAEDLVRNNFPEIKSYKLKRNFLTSTLNWEVQLRSPVAKIQADKQYFIDEDGVIISFDLKQNLPLLELNFPIYSVEIGSRFTQESIKKSLHLLNEMALRLFVVKKIKVVTDYQIDIHLNDGLKIIYNQNQDIKKLDSLQLIFTRAKIEGKRIIQIDLRYDKPIVIYE